MFETYCVSPIFAEKFLGLEGLDNFSKIEIDVEDEFITSVRGIKNKDAIHLGIQHYKLDYETKNELLEECQ